MKMPTVVGIFIFITRENFMLSSVEHEKSFITSGPGKKVESCLELWTTHGKKFYNLGARKKCGILFGVVDNSW